MFIDNKQNNKQELGQAALVGGKDNSSLYDKLQIDDFLINYATFIPRLDSWVLSETSSIGSLQLSFIYELNNSNYSFSLPLFTDLQDKFSNSYLEDNSINLRSQSVQGHRKRHLDRFSGAIYNPFVMISVGLGMLVNLFTAIPYNNILQTQKPDITPTSLNNRNIKLHLAFLAVSIIYFIPPVFSSLAKRMKSEVLNIFAEIEQNIQNNEIEVANNKLVNLRAWYKVLLHSKFPDNLDLRWSYHYLDAVIADRWGQNQRAESSYKFALQLAYTTDKKFLALKGLINLYDKLKAQTYDSSYYEANIKNYAAQIPMVSNLYKKFAIDLKMELLACINSLRDGKYAEANERFSNIKWDCFSENIYSINTIMYYQLKAALTLIGQYEGCDTLDPDSRFKFAYQDLLKVHEYIAKHCPDKLVPSQIGIDSFKKFIEESLKSSANRVQTAMTRVHDCEPQQAKEEERVLPVEEKFKGRGITFVLS